MVLTANHGYRWLSFVKYGYALLWMVIECYYGMDS